MASMCISFNFGLASGRWSGSLACLARDLGCTLLLFFALYLYCPWSFPYAVVFVLYNELCLFV
jgi:hypothetical protein